MTAALIPLTITPGFLFYFDITPKIIILLLSTSLMLCFCKQNVSNFRVLLAAKTGRWFIMLVSIAWFSTALSTALSGNPVLSLNGGNWRRFGLMTETGLLLFTLMTAAWLFRNRDHTRSLLRACTVAGALGALYGIAQYFGWDPLLPAKAYQAGEGPFTIVRPPGTLGHADYFAAWLVAIVFLGLALERMEQARWRKMFALIASVLAVFAIALTGTRAALVGLFAGAVLMIVISRRRPGKLVLVSCGALAACFVVFYFSPAGSKLRARLHWSLDDPRGGARLRLWRDSAAMASRKLLTGFGPETFGSEFPRFESIELARAYPDFYHESPHNVLLDMLTTRGVLGLLPFLALCGVAFLGGFRSRVPYAVPLIAGLAAMLVCHQFTVFVAGTALYFYLVLAMLVVAEHDGLATLTEPRPFERGGWCFAALGIVVSLVLAAFAVRLLIADHALAVTQQRLEAGDATSAARAYRRVLRWQPAGSSADLYYSRATAQLASAAPNLLVRMQASQQSVEAGVRATRTSEERQNAWYNLAMLLAKQNDPAGVERSLRNAIAFAPNWFKPHWTLAQFLELEHRDAEARAEAAKALELDGGHDPEVYATWQRLLGGNSVKP